MKIRRMKINGLKDKIDQMHDSLLEQAQSFMYDTGMHDSIIIPFLLGKSKKYDDNVLYTAEPIPYDSNQNKDIIENLIISGALAVTVITEMGIKEPGEDKYELDLHIITFGINNYEKITCLSATEVEGLIIDLTEVERKNIIDVWSWMGHAFDSYVHFGNGMIN